LVREKRLPFLTAVLTVCCACSSSAVDSSVELSAIPREINASGQFSVLTAKVFDKAGKPGKGSVVFKGPAGTLKTAVSVPLGPTGEASVDFSCSAAQDPGCVGNLRVSVEWTSGSEFASTFLNVLVGESETGAGGGSAETFGSGACLAGGNIITVIGDADDLVHPGPKTLTQGDWFASPQMNAAKTLLTISFVPTDAKDGTWYLTFSSSQLGMPLSEKLYMPVEQASSAPAGFAGLEVTGNSRGCRVLNGAFRIGKITWEGDTLKEFTASFEQHCLGLKPALRGCVHFAQ
jgi:hypothetical protein